MRYSKIGKGGKSEEIEEIAKIIILGNQNQRTETNRNR